MIDCAWWNSFERAEAELFRALNAFVEPAARAGWWSPGLLPTGLVVVETVGRKSGHATRLPLLCTVADDCVFVSTIRGDRARWIENLGASTAVRYWLGGVERRGRPLVFAPGLPRPAASDMPPLARLLAASVEPFALGFGWSFAVLVPGGSPRVDL